MGAGLAALAGLGRGSGGLLEGMITGDKLALEQEQLAAQRQYQQGHLDLLRQQLMMPMILQQQKQQQAAEIGPQLAAALQPGMASVKPGTTFESAPAPLAPRPAAPISSVTTPEDPMAKLRRVLPILARYDPGEAIKATMAMATPQKPVHQFVPENSPGYFDEAGIYHPTPTQPAAPVTPPPGTRPTLKVDAHGRQSWEYGYAPEHEITADEVERAISNAKANPGDAAAQQAAQTAVAAWKRRESLAKSGATAITVKPADTAEVQRAATLGSAIEGLRKLATTAASHGPGGWLTHHRQRAGTAVEDVTGVPLLSEAEAAYISDFDAAQANFMSALNQSGMRASETLMRLAREAFSDKFAPNAAARLNALSNRLDMELRIFQRTVASGMKIPPSPGELPPPGPAPSKTLPPAGAFIEGLFGGGGSPAQAPIKAPPTQGPQAPRGRLTPQQYQAIRQKGYSDEEIRAKGWALP